MAIRFPQTTSRYFNGTVTDRIHTGGASLADVGEWLARHYDARAELTLSILQSLDAPLAVLIHVLAFVYAVTVDVAAGLLTAFGYSLTDVLASWP